MLSLIKEKYLIFDIQIITHPSSACAVYTIILSMASLRLLALNPQLYLFREPVVEKYQDMPFLGAFGRYLNLSFFLLELIAAFCLHEWFFVSLWNHRYGTAKP